MESPQLILLSLHEGQKMIFFLKKANRNLAEYGWGINRVVICPWKLRQSRFSDISFTYYVLQTRIMATLGIKSTGHIIETCNSQRPTFNFAGNIFFPFIFYLKRKKSYFFLSRPLLSSFFLFRAGLSPFSSSPEPSDQAKLLFMRNLTLNHIQSLSELSKAILATLPSAFKI